MLQNNLFFHASLEELHKHVSPSILPDEYKGEIGPFSNKDVHSAIMRHEKYFVEVKEMADKYNNKHSWEMHVRCQDLLRNIICFGQVRYSCRE